MERYSGNDELLKRLGKEKKSTYVVQWLISAIQQGNFKVGDKLPPQRTLAERLGVSRTAVREALSSLQAAGVVEPRVGDGTYVVSSLIPEADVEEALNALRESGALAEVWRIRRNLEVIIACLALPKATPLDLQHLEECYLKIKKAVKARDADEYLEANDALHIFIAEMARNPFLKRALVPLLEITSHQLSTVIDSAYLESHGEDIVDKHWGIVRAFKEGKIEELPDIIRQHFEVSEGLFLGPNA